MSTPDKTGRFAIAVLLVASALLADSGGAEDLDRGLEAFKAGNYLEAAAYLQRYRESFPGDAAVLVPLGWAEYRQGRFEAAGEAFAAALDRDPGFTDARVGLGYVRLQRESPGAAAAEFLQVLRERREDRDALNGLVLCGRRSDDRSILAEGVRAAQQLMRLGEEDPAAAEAWIELQARIGGPAEHRLGAPVGPSEPLRMEVRAVRDAFEIRGPGATWERIFVRGFNLGTALPGRFPTEFPRDESIYRDWLATMSDLGANTVRLYTLLPPEFYRALAAHNAASVRPLFLIQGVWTELPPAHDFGDAGFNEGFEREIARVIDAVHGNLLLAPRPGHASGAYREDVSDWLLAYVIGREWEPFAVADYLRSDPSQSTWVGDWLVASNANAMERWVAARCDFAVGYEVSRHRWLHPVTFANWPTLDPLHHPTESNREEEDRWRRHYGIPHPQTLREQPWEDDRVSVDATRVRPTEAMTAGFFASYHVYPNYPDFINLGEGFAEVRDHAGPSRYAGYLRALKAYHGSQPVLIAEFGISTSRGIAHVQPQGWHHGGHDESAQGELVARMLRSIHDELYAGGIVFSFLDEWFKGTWSAAPLEIPAERRRLWFNAESPEQSYGVLAARPAASGIVLDGDPGDWAGVEPLALHDRARRTRSGWRSLRAVRAASDEGYLYLLVETGGGTDPPDWSRIAYRVALDTYDSSRGARRLPEPGPARTPTGIEFLVDVLGPGRSTVRVVEPYEPYARLDGGPLASTLDGDAPFVSLLFETNRERFGRDGTRFPAVRVDRGELRFGTLAPSSPLRDTRSDVAVGTGTLEIRLPWSLLNVADPSARRVLHDPAGHGQPFETVETDGFRVYLFVLDPARPAAAPRDRLPRRGDVPPVFAWTGWEQPAYRLELKAGAGRLREMMEALSAPANRGDLEE